ncbi:MAG: hypothetical protein AVDCRST_MAG88-3448, partial [uncultured Thermomicrobiales bacterium]
PPAITSPGVNTAAGAAGNRPGAHRLRDVRRARRAREWWNGGGAGAHWAWARRSSPQRARQRPAAGARRQRARPRPARQRRRRARSSRQPDGAARHDREFRHPYGPV